MALTSSNPFVFNPVPKSSGSAGVGAGAGQCTSSEKNPGSGTGYYTSSGGWVDISRGITYQTPPPSQGYSSGGSSSSGSVSSFGQSSGNVLIDAAVKIQEVEKAKQVEKPKPVPSYSSQTASAPKQQGILEKGVSAVGESIKYNFPVTRGESYTAEELREGWKGAGSWEQAKGNIDRSRQLGTGLTFGLAALGPVAKGASSLLPSISKTIAPVVAKVVPSGTDVMSGLFSKSIYTPGIVTQAGRVIASAAKTPIGGLVKGVGISFVLSQTASPVAKGVYNIAVPSELSEKERIKVSQKARERTEERIGTEGLNLPFVSAETEQQFTANIIGSSVYSLPGGTALAGKKYYEETVKVLKEQGYSQADAERNAKTESEREVIAGSVGEFIAFVPGAGAIGELVGRSTGKVTGKALGAGEKVFTKGAGTLASTITGASAGVAGGLVEGALFYPGMQQARYKPIKGEEWVLQTALSGATAGLAGGVIGGLSVQAPKLGKVSYHILGALEGGQEQGGDVMAERFVGDSLDTFFWIRGAGKVKPKTRVTGIVPGLTGTPSPSLTQTQTRTGTPTVSNTLIGTMQPTIAPAWTPTSTPTPTPAPVPTITETPTPTPTPTPVPVWTPTFVPTEEPTQTQTPTQTPTQTFTYTSTPTQTFVPTYTGPFLPFIPPLGGEDAFPGKSGRREKSRFIDEFTLAFAGLARPSQPVYFGKQKPIALTRKQYAPKKRKGKKSRAGGFNQERFQALFV